MESGFQSHGYRIQRAKLGTFPVFWNSGLFTRSGTNEYLVILQGKAEKVHLYSELLVLQAAGTMKIMTYIFYFFRNKKDIPTAEKG